MDGMCVHQVCISIYYYYHWYIHWGDKRKGMGVCLVYLVRTGVGYGIWLGGTLPGRGGNCKSWKMWMRCDVMLEAGRWTL